MWGLAVLWQRLSWYIHWVGRIEYCIAMAMVIDKAVCDNASKDVQFSQDAMSDSATLDPVEKPKIPWP